LFWTFGRKAGERITSSTEDEIEFFEETHTQHTPDPEPVAT
jgi:hypothetical protein